MIKGLKFDPREHRFSCKGRPVPSVTQVLKDLGFLSNWYTPKAAKRGENVHHACSLVVQGKLDWESLSQKIVRYVEGFEQFLIDHPELKFTETETIVSHESLWYAGIADLCGQRDDGHPIVVDIKSGQKESWHRLQCQGYATAQMESYNALVPSHAMLYLKPNGTYELSKFQIGIREWMCVMTTYNLKNNKELRKWLT